MIPGLREQWTGAWYEAELRRHRGRRLPCRLPGGDSPRRRRGSDRRRAALGQAIRRRVGGRDRRRADPRWDPGQRRRRLGRRRRGPLPECRASALQPMRRTVVQLRVGRDGLQATCRWSPTSTPASISRARATAASGSARWTKRRSTRATPRPRRSTSQPRSTDSSKRSTGRSRRSSANGPGLRTFAPDRAHQVRLRSRGAGLLLVRGAGRHGHPDRAGGVLAVRAPDSR